MCGLQSSPTPPRRKVATLPHFFLKSSTSRPPALPVVRGPWSVGCRLWPCSPDLSSAGQTGPLSPVTPPAACIGPLPDMGVARSGTGAGAGGQAPPLHILDVAQDKLLGGLRGRRPGLPLHRVWTRGCTQVPLPPSLV